MHDRPGRIVEILENPFTQELGDRSAAQLRMKPEFIEMRENLVKSIHQD